MVFATREPGEDLRHLPELEVRGLTNGDARGLLESVVRFKLDERVSDRITAETRGFRRVGWRRDNACPLHSRSGPDARVARTR